MVQNIFLLYFRNYLLKPDLQFRKCYFIFWLRPQYFWVGSKIFKKLPTILNLKEKGIRALLFKRGLKKCDSSQLDCSKVADALLSKHQQYLLKDLHLSLSASEWLCCLQWNPQLCRCSFNVNENVHDTHTHTQPLYKMPSQVCTSISQVSGLYSVPHYWMSVTAKVLHTCSNMFPSWL